MLSNMLSNMTFVMIFGVFEINAIRNFHGRSAVRGQCASLYQISSKSVKRLQRYGDLTFFQNGGRPPSWISFAIFAIFKMAAADILNFQKFKILTVDPL